MSGFGHVQDMNNRIKQNRAQRPSKRPKFKENNRENIYSDSDKKVNRPNFKTVSEEELIEILKHIRERAAKEKRAHSLRDFLFYRNGNYYFVFNLDELDDLSKTMRKRNWHRNKRPVNELPE